MEDTSRRNRTKKYFGIAFRVASYAVLLLIVVMNANLQTLSYFIPDMQTSIEQKLQAVQTIATLTILLGSIGIIFSGLDSILSRKEVDDRFQQLEKRLIEAEKKVLRQPNFDSLSGQADQPKT